MTSSKNTPSRARHAPEEKAEPFHFAGHTIGPGQRRRIEIPIARLSFGAPVSLDAEIVVGKKPGPVLFVTAAIHGDEINGVEVISRLSRVRALSRLRGVLIMIPVVNVFGFMAQSRYLPDRRDLNRSFPGSPGGSLAGQIANAMMEHVIAPADFGIDLHTGAIHRRNLPQIRANLEDERLKALALAFGAPVAMDASLLEGSLRHAAHEQGVPVMTYEGGEALRFDERSIRAGTNGVLRVMQELGMLGAIHKPLKKKPSIARSSKWLRAPSAGVLRTEVKLGAEVREGAELGYVAGPFGDEPEAVIADRDGIVVGLSALPVVNRGDALFHVAQVRDAGATVKQIDAFAEEMMQSPNLWDNGSQS